MESPLPAALSPDCSAEDELDDELESDESESDGSGGRSYMPLMAWPIRSKSHITAFVRRQMVLCEIVSRVLLFWFALWVRISACDLRNCPRGRS